MMRRCGAQRPDSSIPHDDALSSPASRCEWWPEWLDEAISTSNDRHDPGPVWRPAPPELRPRHEAVLGARARRRPRRRLASQQLTHPVLLAVIVAVIAASSLWRPGLSAALPQGSRQAAVDGAAPAAGTPAPSTPTPSLTLAHYVTREGETLADVAAATGRSVETLLWANSIQEPEARFPAGVVLDIPPADGVLHVVQPGDTLASIAGYYGTTIEAITGFGPNGVHSDTDLSPGKLLMVPEASMRQRGSVITYTVREGDTIRSIAARFGLQTKTILWANTIPDPDLIYPGQQLTILPTDGILVRVEEGDTIRGLAERYGVDPADIYGYAPNAIDNPDLILVGQELVIPGAEPLPAAPPEPEVTETADTGAAQATTDSQAQETASGDQAASDEATAVPLAVETTPEATPEATTTPEPAAEQQEGETQQASEEAQPTPTSEEATPEATPADTPAPEATPAETPAPEATEAAPTPAPEPEPATAPEGPAQQAPTGSFIWPAEGVITQYFHRGHNGWDIANRMYTEIVAADSGTVIFSGWNTYGLGYAVAIDHGNGYVTWYGHMAEPPPVQVGQWVNQGQYIGPMGSTGYSTGPHVHFMIVKNGVYQDPALYLR